MRSRLAGLTLMLLLAGRLHAQEPAATDPVPAAQAAADASKADAPEKSDTPLKDKRRESVEIGFVLIGGIGILGVFVIAFALVWGRRIRRRAQAGRSPSKLRDELWYLKSKPAAPGTEETDV